MISFDKENKPKGQIIITGAAGGMGMATCELLAQKGYQIIAVDHNKERLDKLQNLDSTITPIITDLNDPQLTLKVSEAINAAIPVVGLVNLVGVSKGHALDQLTDQDWDEAFAINVTPAMKLTRLLAPLMRQHKYGSIVMADITIV